MKMSRNLAIENKGVRVPIKTLISGTQSIYPARLPLQLWCALAIGQDDWIVAPRGLQVGLDLFLARASPGSVVTLCNSYTAVSKQYGDPIEGNTGEQKLHGEGIAESVSVSVRHFGQLIESLQSPLPFAFGTPQS